MLNHTNWNGKCISCGSRMFLKEIYNQGFPETGIETNLIMKCLDENKTNCTWYHWLDLKTTKEERETAKPGVVALVFLSYEKSSNEISRRRWKRICYHG
jgi:hypothetical protein